MSDNPFDTPEFTLEPCAGDTRTDDQGRLWTSCPIAYGARGGRWAYWTTLGRVVVDTHQHFHASRFAGMLAVPWDGLSKLGWVLDKAHCQPVAEKLEPAPQDRVRFERLDKPPED